MEKKNYLLCCLPQRLGFVRIEFNKIIEATLVNLLSIGVQRKCHLTHILFTIVCCCQQNNELGLLQQTEDHRYAREAVLGAKLILEVRLEKASV